LIAVPVIVAIAAALWFLPVKHSLLAILEYVQDLGAWGPVLVIIFYVIAAVLFLPGSVLTLGSGFLFGIPLGLLTVWIGAGLGACAAFLVGRTVARDWIIPRAARYEKIAALDAAMEKEGFKIVFLLRLSPFVPFNFLNFGLGLTRVSFKDYALASLIGMLPAEFLYIYMGSAARSLTEAATGRVESGLAGQILFWGGLLATTLVTVFVTRFAKRGIEAAQASARCNEEAHTNSE